jgi:hypothetical protein
MAFKKGTSGNPDGRRPGARNRVTKAVRESVLEALNEGKGATAFFVRLKNSRAAADRRTFAMVCSKLIPTAIDIDIDDSPLSTGVVVILPDNGRGPRMGETIEEFNARFEARVADEAKT